jgi:hypothetical protein
VSGFRKADGFEGQCNGCLDWFPLDVEFWAPSRGLRFCRVCEREKTRARMAVIRGEQTRARYGAQHMDYYRANRDWILAKRRVTHQHRRLTDARPTSSASASLPARVHAPEAGRLMDRLAYWLAVSERIEIAQRARLDRWQKRTDSARFWSNRDRGARHREQNRAWKRSKAA